MEDSLRIVHWYLDPANHKEVMEICARITKQPAERFVWIFTNNDNYRDPNMMPDLSALQRNVDLTAIWVSLERALTSTNSPISAWCLTPPNDCNEPPGPLHTGSNLAMRDNVRLAMILEFVTFKNTRQLGTQTRA
jgi:hypothetical protein